MRAARRVGALGFWLALLLAVGLLGERLFGNPLWGYAAALGAVLALGALAWLVVLVAGPRSRDPVRPWRRRSPGAAPGGRRPPRKPRR